MILTVFVNIIGLCLTVFAENIFLASLGLFLNFAAKCIQLEIIVCVIIEATS